MTDLSRRAAAVRRFNRFYTKHIGVLHEGLLDSPFPLTEARVLYDLAHMGETTATALGAGLGIDAGYLSRILRRFEGRGLLEKRRAPDDRRRHLIRLTAAGRDAFAMLDARSEATFAGILGGLPEAAQKRLVGAMHAIEGILGAPGEAPAAWMLRPHQPGDWGWIVQRHGALYAAEYGWDERFEGLVAGIVAGIIESFDETRERCWIAEVEGQAMGSVVLVRYADDVASLRLLLVEPAARGLGIGRRLVTECERFARRAGYRKIRLWTNDVLVAARHIYQAAGYRLVEAEPHHSFGHSMVGEVWELDLGADAA